MESVILGAVSVTGKRLREQFGFDFYGQFDGLRRAAEGMIDFTRRLAS